MSLLMNVTARGAVLVVIGAVVGGTTAAGLMLRRDTAKTEASPAAAEVPSTVDTSGLELRIRQLERRAVETPPRASSVPAVQAPASSGAPVSPPPEEVARNWLETKKIREAQVASESVDNKWSKEANAAFRKELGEIGARGKFTVGDVDCRTTSCLAKVDWGSYSDAESGWHQVMFGHYSKNCSRQVFVPAPDEEHLNAPYEGEVFFDCTDDRAQ
jgi:hypothetical protein